MRFGLVTLFTFFFIHCVYSDKNTYSILKDETLRCKIDGSWPSIRVNTEYYVFCGSQKIGSISRKCIQVGNNATWEDPDESSCYPRSILNSAPSGNLFSVVVLNVKNITVVYNANEQELLRIKLVNFTQPLLNIKSESVYLTDCNSIIVSHDVHQTTELLIYFYISIPSDYAKSYTQSIISFLNNLKGSDFESTNNPYLMRSVFSVDKDKSYIIEKTDSLLTIILIVLVVFIGIDCVSYLAYRKIKNMQMKIRDNKESVYSRMIE